MAGVPPVGGWGGGQGVRGPSGAERGRKPALLGINRFGMGLLG
jgi:hypothetical protein